MKVSRNTGSRIDRITVKTGKLAENEKKSGKGLHGFDLFPILGFMTIESA